MSEKNGKHLRFADLVISEAEQAVADDHTRMITTRSEGLLGQIGMWGAALITDEELLEAVAAHDAQKRAEWEAEQGETEWEYAVRDAKDRILFTATAGARPGDVAIRRRKAGPWSPVPDTGAES